MNTAPPWFLTAGFLYANAFSLQANPRELYVVFAKELPGERVVNVQGVILGLSRARELHEMLGKILAEQEKLDVKPERKFDA